MSQFGADQLGQIQFGGVSDQFRMLTVGDSADRLYELADGEWAEFDPTVSSIHPTLPAVWGDDAGNIVVSGNGVFSHYLPSTGAWVTKAMPISTSIDSIFGFGTNDIYAANLTYVFHYNGTSWSTVLGPIAGNVSSKASIWGSGPDDVWVSLHHYSLFGTKNMWHWDGNSWARDSYFSNNKLPHGIWGFGPNEVYTAGVQMASPVYTFYIWKWDGNSWSVVYGPRNWFHADHCTGDALWGTDGNNLWIGGGEAYLDNGLTRAGITYFNGVSGVSQYTGGTYGSFRTIRGLNTQEVWAVSDSSSDKGLYKLNTVSGQFEKITSSPINQTDAYTDLGSWKPVISDPEPPYLDNQDPAPLDTGVAKEKIIGFDVLDDVTDVTVSLIEVEGFTAYDGSFQSPYDGAGSSVTPITGGFSFAIQKTSDWSSYSTVSVRVVAEDEVGNPLDETWTFEIEDYDVPSIGSNLPLGADIVETTDISFSITDIGGTGAVQSTLNATVNSVPAIVAGVLQAGFQGPNSAITPNASNGFDVVIDLESLYGELEHVEVDVSVEDTVGNEGTLLWAFTVRDYLGPLVDPVFPSAGGSGISVGTNITIDVTDEDTISGKKIEVDLNDGNGFQEAYVQGDDPPFKSGWQGAGSEVTSLANGYRIVLDPETDFTVATTIQVRVTAIDPAGNPERLS